MRKYISLIIASLVLFFGAISCSGCKEEKDDIAVSQSQSNAAVFEETTTPPSPPKLKERRVYYLDCSYSMKQNELWDTVRANLKKAIDGVKDESTELIVIPFADNASASPVLNPMIYQATNQGKKELKDKIDALPMNRNTMTYHYVPIEDFYKNRVAPGKITYMFLMTDGKDEDEARRTVNDLLPQWGDRYGNENVYGFYVMLHKDAKDDEISKVVDEQDHLWKVETADVNINLIRLQPPTEYNPTNDDYFYLAIDGNVADKEFKASFPSDCPYQVKKVEVVENDRFLKVWVTKPNTKESATHNLNVTMNNGGKFDFLVTDNVDIKCEFKPERSLKISVR